jgi:cation transport ATPase
MMTCLGLAAFFSMNVMVFTFFLWSEGTGPEGSEQAAVLYDLARYASLVFTVPVLFLLGGPLVESAIDEARRGRVSIDCLLVAGVAASFAISAWATWHGALGGHARTLV